MATVTFDDVHKRFGDVEALKDFSLDIADGEFVVLVGPSGCGQDDGAAAARRAREHHRRVASGSASGS